MEDRRKWCVVFEDAAKRMLRYLEDSEYLKVSISELKGQLETLEKAGFFHHTNCPVGQGMKKAKKLFETFRQEENEVYIASLARWDTQLKGLVELERRCQELKQEVKLLSERQEVLAGLVEDKTRLQSKATEKYYETIFEELRELEVKKSKEALLLVTSFYDVIVKGKRARMLQRLGGRDRQDMGLTHSRYPFL